MQGVNRGASWVAVQFTLMIAVIAAGPLSNGHWNGPTSFAAGAVLTVFGAWAGLRGKHDLGRMRTPFPKPKNDNELVTHGIYARIRHPLYASVMSLGIAWALFWQSGPALCLAFVQAAFLHAKALREERWLQSRHPGYAGYAERVPRYIPSAERRT